MRLKSIIILLVIFLALSGYYYVSSKPQPTPKPEPQLYVWMIDMEAIKHIEVELPREGKSQLFVKIPEGDKFPWHFDDPQKSKVDAQRWGGGIPLLLSGPGVDRVVSENTTDEKLAEFGLTQPQMKISLTLESGDIMSIKVGDSAPDGHAYYVQVPDSNDVALVDYSWYEVLERLVTEPPYASS
ncbi:DUF4340 domain-containing protein [Chloroflexota bacterium]